MAENGHNSQEQSKTTVDKEARLRHVKERQNEERQRKLEEIKAQALAAQRFKEQKEQERRQRLEEMRLKEDTRRHQVEERKKAINDAERNRLESIIHRNQEREARMEFKKKHERSNIVFAFGSSTPRNLDPTDASVSYWGARRATSTQNIMSSSMTGSALTRRQSERELDNGSKKRATSAGGLDRSIEAGSLSPSIPAGSPSGYLGRRRTDLVPTIPSRDTSFHSSGSRRSLNQSPASSRPSSSMSQQSTNSVTNSVNMRHRKSATPRRPRPASIAGTGVTVPEQKDSKPPLPTARRSITKSRESSIIKSKSKEILSKSDSKPETKRKPEEKSKEKTEKSVRNIGKVEVKTPPEPVQKSDAIKTPPEPVPRSESGETELVHKTENNINENTTNEKIKNEVKENKDPEKNGIEVTPSESQPVENFIIKNEPVEVAAPIEAKVLEQVAYKHQDCAEFIKQEIKHQEEIHVTQPIKGTVDPPEANPGSVTEPPIQTQPGQKEVAAEVTPFPAPINAEPKEGENGESIMSTSMTKSRITTEEEAKAALAEKRRFAREEAERKAREEAERIEIEQRAELERQRKEEEEIHNLAQMQRQAEQERLQEAIREAQKREEEERLKREDEQRLKLLKEEADKKAREEAERQKLELQEKLKNEEKEREERRKRVEMIMSRTRGKNNAIPQQNSQDKNENKSEKDDESKLNEENQLNDENKLNGAKQENGTKEKEQENGMVDNIIPDESVKNNANTILSDDRISTADSLNSNNAWQASQQYGSTNLVCNNNS